MRTGRHYHVYGLCVRSPWALPCLESDEDHPCAIELTESASSLVDSSELQDGASQFTTLKNGSTYLRWPGPTEFLVSVDGSRIVARLSSAESHSTLQAVLFGGVFSVALLRMGIDQLHAAAIVAGNAAVGFMGDTGAGKSTLAAAFVRKGFSLLTDDLLVIHSRQNSLLAQSGLPRLKLCNDSGTSMMAEALGDELGVNSFTGKRVVRLHERHFYASEIPMRALYVLQSSPNTSGVAIEPLSQQEAFVEICRAAFNSYITPADRLRQHFVLASQLASGISVKRLLFPRNFEELPRVCDRILSDF